MVFAMKVTIEYSVDYWCCNPFKKLVNEGRSIFFDKETGEFVNMDDDVLKVCPFCTSEFVNKNFQG
jgi:hypothetical protein